MIDPQLAAAEEELRRFLVWIAYVDLLDESGLHRLARMRYREIGRSYDALRRGLIDLFQSEDYGQRFDRLVDEKVAHLKRMATIQGTARLLAMMGQEQNADKAI